MPITYFFVMFVRIAHVFLYHKQVYPAKSKTGNQTWITALIYVDNTYHLDHIMLTDMA